MDEQLVARRHFPRHLSSMHIEIWDEDLTFVNLQRLLPDHLRHLSICGSLADDDLQDYLNVSHWREMFHRRPTQLQRIQLDLSSYFDLNDSHGLRTMLRTFRKERFFRHVKIRSDNFAIEMRGFVERDDDDEVRVQL